jgi:hypothetical protein
VNFDDDVSVDAAAVERFTLEPTRPLTADAAREDFDVAWTLRGVDRKALDNPFLPDARAYEQAREKYVRESGELRSQVLYELFAFHAVGSDPGAAAAEADAELRAYDERVESVVETVDWVVRRIKAQEQAEREKEARPVVRPPARELRPVRCTPALRLHRRRVGTPRPNAARRRRPTRTASRAGPRRRSDDPDPVGHRRREVAR